jgi:prepilin-type N-terminal cleavage/methylation domain-containing protein
MLDKKRPKAKAFTLVELIVVIAIVAILSAVLIPSLSRFIDKGRYSNDVQAAKSMTSILDGYSISHPEESLDAHDVRSIINEYHGDAFNYTPESANTGFFYVESTNEIRALRYNEAEFIIEELVELQHFNGPQLLSSHRLNSSSYGNSPEELFGKGGHLLTTNGSAIAMAVGFVRNMAKSQSSISNYDQVVAALDNFESNPFIRFFLGNIDDEVLDRVKDMIAYYNPNDTLFVNNSSWATGQGNDESSKILFASDISNIPKFNISGVQFTGDEVVLPKSIRTIAAGAFSNSVFNEDSISFQITGSAEILAAPNAFSSELINKVNFNLVIGEIGLTDYSDYITIDFDGVDYKYSFQNLPIRDQVTGYAIEVSGSVVTVKIYTPNGLVGYATNLKVVNYYLDSSDLYPYFRVQTANDEFYLPQEPTRDDKVFGGWYSDPDMWENKLEENDELMYRTTNVYAKWN